MQRPAIDLFQIIEDVYNRYPRNHPLRIKAVMALRHYLPTVRPFDLKEEEEYLRIRSTEVHHD